jgi:predicted nucleic acid-binding protein
VFLIDTNVISEARKATRAHPGVSAFFREAADRGDALYLSVVTLGELRRGVELIRHRGDVTQANLLESWLDGVVHDFADAILPFDADAAQIWGRLRVPHAEHEIDKQIAATALIHDLTVVTRNVADFIGTGVRLRDPFSG